MTTSTLAPMTVQQIAELDALHTRLTALQADYDALYDRLKASGEHHVGVGIVASYLGAGGDFLTKYRQDWGLYPVATAASQEGRA